MRRSVARVLDPCARHADRAVGSESALDRLRHALRWPLPARPAPIAGPLYFVGTQGLGSWLFATGDGLILLNTGLPHSGPMIARSMDELGFAVSDIRCLLVSHAHIDHAGAIAWFRKRAADAEVCVMDADAAALADGGRSDFAYGRFLLARFPPVKVDRVLKDGDVVARGGVALAARKTPGHTPGATTWTTTLTDDGRSYEVAFPDGLGVNPGYRLIDNPSYPGIVEDYRASLRWLARQSPDIWLTHHGELDNFRRRRKRAETLGAEGWVNASGYAPWVQQARRTFEAELSRQRRERRRR